MIFVDTIFDFLFDKTFFCLKSSETYGKMFPSKSEQKISFMPRPPKPPDSWRTSPQRNKKIDVPTKKMHLHHYCRDTKNLRKFKKISRLSKVYQ